MKALLLCFATSCWLLPAFGQSPTAQLFNEQFSDTTDVWYKWTKKREQHIGLKSIEASTYPFHFRLSQGGTVLDMWRQDNRFHGILTKWADEVDETMGTLARFYSQQYVLSPDQAASIGQLIKESGILKLPSEEHIQGWQQGLDGIEIIIQYIDNKTYHLQHYWTPSAQEGLAEALLVQQFDTKAFDLSNAAMVLKVFEAGIPFPCYTTTNGFLVACKILTTTEYWQHKREINRYLRQHKNKNNN